VFKVVLTQPFERWLDGLRDAPTRRWLVLRLRKASLGQLGDVLILMLGGGTKGTQARDAGLIVEAERLDLQ